MCHGKVNMDSLLLLCNFTDGTRGKLYSQINAYVSPMSRYPVVPLLTFKEPQGFTLDELFMKAGSENSPEATARLLLAILSAEVKTTFHKINVHAALTPADIEKLFEPVFSQAKDLREAYQKKHHRMKGEIRLIDQAKSNPSTLYFPSSSFAISPSTVPFVTVSIPTVSHNYMILQISS